MDEVSVITTVKGITEACHSDITSSNQFLNEISDTLLNVDKNISGGTFANPCKDILGGMRTELSAIKGMLIESLQVKI